MKSTTFQALAIKLGITRQSLTAHAKSIPDFDLKEGENACLARLWQSKTDKLANKKDRTLTEIREERERVKLAIDHEVLKKAELEHSIALRELVSVQEVQENWDDAMTLAHGKLCTIPDRLAPGLAGQSLEVIRDVLTNEIHHILDDLSDASNRV